jgi:hypothetical protein
MNKIALLLTAVLIAGFITINITDCPWALQYDLQDEKKLQERIAAYQCFKETLDDSLEALAKREMTLKEACKQVVSASRQSQPTYLYALRFTESGSTDAERVARNLVYHVGNIEVVDPLISPRLRELEIELEEFVREQAAP